MANNRLWLFHPDTGKRFYLAKRMASGWYVPAYHHGNTEDALNDFFDSVEFKGAQDHFELRLEDNEFAPDIPKMTSEEYDRGDRSKEEWGD